MDLCGLAQFREVFVETRGIVKVRGTIDGCAFESSFMAMADGRRMLPVKLEIRKAIGKEAREIVKVRLVAFREQVSIFLPCDRLNTKRGPTRRRLQWKMPARLTIRERKVIPTIQKVR